MKSNKISLTELKTYIQKEAKKLAESELKEGSDGIGTNLRSLLDGMITIALKEGDLSMYDFRNDLISKIEKRLNEGDWISLSDGTTFEKTFTPRQK